MENSVKEFFERYESFFNQSLSGNTDMDEAAALYASEFIAASPTRLCALSGDRDEGNADTRRPPLPHR
jgi:hypothetical protein